MLPIQMVDLKQQYFNHKMEFDRAVQDSLSNGQYIGGVAVASFEAHLSDYIGIKNVIGCGNGTDAIQLALMALNLPKGAKIMVPAFTYIAPVEVIALLGFEIVYVDVELDFNTSLDKIKEVFTDDIKAIVVVHLFGQPIEDINLIYDFCVEKNIALIEDNAQTLGAEKNIKRNSILTTSFFPTKNLGAFGDGGAVLTNDDVLANYIRKIASHGQSEKYIHDIVGINSRLDTIQASILNVKLKYLNEYNQKRKDNAKFYQNELNNLNEIILPNITEQHIFHQYTIQVKNDKRNDLKKYLKEKNIESTINYPMPTYKQKAYLNKNIVLKNTEILCQNALSIPVYPEISEVQLLYICNTIKMFFNINE